MLRIRFLFLMGVFLGCQKEAPFEPKSARLQTLQTFGGERNDEAFDISVAPDGSYWVWAETQSTAIAEHPREATDFDAWGLHFSNAHVLEQQIFLGGAADDRPQRTLSLLNTDRLIVGSTTDDSSAGQQDFWLQRITEDGELIWKKTYGFSGVEIAYDALEMPNGDLIVCGIMDVTAAGGLGNFPADKSSQKHAGGDYWVLRLNPQGELLWSRYFGGTNTDTAYAVQSDTEGNLWVLGTSDSSDFDVTGNRGTYDGWLLVLNPQGNLLRQASFGGTQLENIRVLEPSSQGDFYIVGDTRSSDGDVSNTLGGADIWVVKVSPTAEILWEKTFGGPDFESAFDALATSNGGLVVVGSSRSSSGDFTHNNGYNDALAFAIDAQGKLLWQKTWGGSDFDRAYAIVEDPLQGFRIVGTTASSDGDMPASNGFYDIFVAHLIPDE